MSLTFIQKLNLKKSFIKDVANNPARHYRLKRRPKMKYGRPQLKPDGSEKIRETHEPTPQLKAVQKRITIELQKIELAPNMFGGIKKRNNKLNASKHVKGKFFLTIDLKDFFKNIIHNQVNQTLIGLGMEWREARIITKLTTYKHCLPQGAPTSTILANLVLLPTVQKLEAFCIQRNITFTNFVDDLTFSSTTDFEYLIPEIKSLLKDGKFYVNYNKIHYTRNTAEVTGLFIKKGILHLEKEMLKNLDKPGVKAYHQSVLKQNKLLQTYDWSMTWITSSASPPLNH